jgi:rhodanese-related sulfurtransferase
VTSIAGYLHGGMTARREEKGAVARTRRVSVPELHELWRRGGVQVLDVRERSEWDAGHIPGAVHVPYHDLHALPDGIDPDAPLAVMCASGQRASVAASLAQRHGASDVWHVVDGGVGTWGRSGFELERPA